MNRIIIFIGAVYICALFSCSKSGDPTVATGVTSSGGTPTNAGGTGNINTTTAPGITDFSPKSAQPGTNITITGTGFGNDVKAIKVAVGNSLFDYPVSVTPTTIVFQTNLGTPSGKIILLIDNKNYYSTNDFTALPEDLDLYGYQGIDGTNRINRQIYFNIKGEPDTSGMTFSFGGTAPVKVNYYFAKYQNLHIYGAIIPKYAKEGKVTLRAGNHTVLSDFDLKFNLSVVDFSPKSVTTGDTIKISGFAFTNTDDMLINFNTPGSGSFVKPLKVTSPNELLVVVPATAKSGALAVSANLGTESYSTFPDVITYTPRVSFSDYLLNPFGKIGDVVEIYGDFADADISKIGVSFNGSVPVKPISLRGSFISVKIPADAKTGKITISRTGYVSATGSFTFTITN